MSRLALYLLGPPRLELDSEEIYIPRRKAMLIHYARECRVARELTDAEREQFGLPAH